MDLSKLLTILNSGEAFIPGSEAYAEMQKYSGQAQEITARLNTGYHTQEEIIDFMSELTGKKVPDSLHIFLPFYSDFGKNITIGENVFINAACQFQDQGGITIGDNCLIGPKVVIATINHTIESPLRGRAPQSLGPVELKENVWIGASAVLLPGVTIGENAVIAAGAVVKDDVPANSVVAGVPARVVKTFKV